MVSICLSIDSALTLNLSSAIYTQYNELLYNLVAQVRPLSPAHSTHSSLTQLEGWLSLAHTDSTETQSEDSDWVWLSSQHSGSAWRRLRSWLPTRLRDSLEEGSESGSHTTVQRLSWKKVAGLAHTQQQATVDSRTTSRRQAGSDYTELLHQERNDSLAESQGLYL